MSEVQPQSDRQGDIRNILGPIWRRRWLVLAVLVLATAGTYLLSDRRDPEFRAGTSLYVQGGGVSDLIDQSSDAITDRTTNNVAALVRTTAVADRAADILNRPDPAALLEQIETSAEQGADFVRITATDGTAKDAAALANAFAKAFVDLRDDDYRSSIEAAIAENQRQLDALPRRVVNATQRNELESNLQRLQLALTIGSTGTRQVEEAQPPGFQASPRPKRDALFAFAVASVAVLFLVFALERFDRRLTRVEDIERAYEQPVLAAIPHARAPVGTKDGLAVVAPEFREPFRSLRTSLQLQTLDQPVRRILVTSAMPGEGKSTTVRNFALTLHEWGLSVVVVDADLRRPTMDKLFELPESTGGLVSVLLGETPLEAALVDIAVEAQGHDVLARIAAAAGTGERAGTSGYRPHTGEGARLAVLPAGQTPPNPQVVLATRRMEQVLTELAETFDVVVIDSPPILAVSDAIPLAQEVDGTLLVSRVGLTSKDAARRLKDLLGRMPQARVFGVVVNDFNTELGADYGAYGYGYGYGSNP